VPAETPIPGVALVLKLGFVSADEFLDKYGAFLSRGGIYLRIKEPKPPGTRIRLDLRLADGQPVLKGWGVVDFVTGRGGQGVPGMGIRFTEMSAESQALIEKLCQRRPTAAFPDPPLPSGVGTADRTPGTVSQATAASAPTTSAPSATKAEAPKARPAPAPTVGPVVSPGAVRATSIESPLDRVKPLPPGQKATGPIIGIDLGTTNSCAAIVQKGKPFVIPSREGYNTVPSIIALNSRGKIVVGHPAKGQMLTNPRLTVYGSKRLVGRPFDSPAVQRIREFFHYEIVPGPNGEAAVKLGDRVFSLQELSAMILLEVREIAQNYLAQEIRRAVITVPAYYNDNQRQAVKEAAALAGLQVERILNEPTAAALAFGYGRDLQKRILVYDLGGGTFDASLLQLNSNIYEVISTGGDTFLGGVDFDNRIVDHLLRHFQTTTGQPFQADRVAMQRITDAAERAKIALSERAETRVQVPFVTAVNGKPFDLDVTLTRNELVDLTSQLIDRSLAICSGVLGDRELGPADVDEVLLVGGQSRMPQVRERVNQFFGKPPSKAVHPDEAVALGAALLGHSLNTIEGVVLIDVLPMAIGIGLPGGRFKRIIDRNSSLPAAKAYTISTARDDQPSLEMSVYQGDSDRTDENEYLGTVRLDGLPKGARGTVKVAVNFSVSGESVLTVTAKELSTAREITATMTARVRPDAVKPETAVQESTPAAAPPSVEAAKTGATESAPAKLGFFGRLRRFFGGGRTEGPQSGAGSASA
jgi:molecular chaperone DnaK